MPATSIVTTITATLVSLALIAAAAAAMNGSAE